MDINDYINSDSVVNTMTKYVGKDLSDFKFVGIVEHMNRDVKSFRICLDWKEPNYQKQISTILWLE